jgi:hypothetical protein
VTVVRAAFAPAWIARVAALGPTPAIEGPLAEPALLDHATIVPRLDAALGDGHLIGRVAAGRAAIEALVQLPARTALFGDPRHDARVPAVALAVIVALADATLAVDGAPVALAAGDALVLDARTPVAASPDASLLLVVHHRHWFREPRAPLDAPPVSISRLVYQRLTAAQRRRFTWRFDRYLRLRPRLLLDQLVRTVRRR